MLLFLGDTSRGPLYLRSSFSLVVVFSIQHLACSHMTVSGFYEDYSTFIFIHHKKVISFLQSFQNQQFQDTQGSGGFFPCFQADCEKLGQLAQYRGRDIYALSAYFTIRTVL